jgi:hypothetical protein
MEARTCHLSLDVCPGAACAFWEDDGCAIERLGLHTLRNADVSEFLLGIRTQLETPRDNALPEPSRGEFARRLGRDV